MGRTLYGGVTSGGLKSTTQILHMYPLLHHMYRMYANSCGTLQYILAKAKHVMYGIGVQNVANKETVFHDSHHVRPSLFLASVNTGKPFKESFQQLNKLAKHELQSRVL